MNPNEIPTLRPPAMVCDRRSAAPRIPRRRYPFACAEVVCASEHDPRRERD
jgi:hypothetical protein